MGQTNEKNSQNCSISQKNIALPTAKGKKEATRAEFLWELLYLLRKFADFIIKISALQKNMIKLKNYFEIGKKSYYRGTRPRFYLKTTACDSWVQNPPFLPSSPFQLGCTFINLPFIKLYLYLKFLLWFKKNPLCT